LDRLLAGELPPPGRIRLAPMLSPSGRLLGDLTVTCWADDEFWLMGSYYLREWHLRHFTRALETLGGAGVTVTDLSDDVAGISLSGPASRDLLAATTADDVSPTALPWLHAGSLDVGLVRVRVGRLSVTGELGYELNVPAAQLTSLYRTVREAGRALAARGVPVVDLGYNALDSLRLEKSYGVWSKEYTWAYTPGMNALGGFVAVDKDADFVGRQAARAERDTPPAQRLVTLEVEVDPAAPADAAPFEPVWDGGRRVGFVTSGGHGHSVGAGLALAYLDADRTAVGTPVEISVVGPRVGARVIPDSPHDPAGRRMRA
jgi:dimethylglycine dehydrogenase